MSQFVRSTTRFALNCKRTFSIFDSKNNIAAIRAKYYSDPRTGADNPTYLKEPRDKYVFGAALAFTAFGILNILYGLTNMMRGVNKVK